MKIGNWTKKLSAALAASGVVCATTVQAQTTLTGLNDTNVDVPIDHGSNESGTPNVALTWSGSGWDQYDGWPNDPGDGVYQVDGASDGTVTHTIDFTPSAGVDIILTALDLNVWTGGGDTDVDWSVDGSSSGNLGAGTWSTTDGTVSNNNINLAGTGGESLTLSLTQTSGFGSYLAMDNLSFDQVGIPEPGTLALLGLGGLGALALRRNRK